jgi:diketogulonate reductase-like aldo/keto reductase
MSDPDRIFARGGAIEAVVDARKVGKVRYIGFTGHKDPQIHLKMLETARTHSFRFDTVQMPLNVMDAHYQSFQQLVLPVLVAGGIGVLAMKPMGSGIILESKTVSAVECLHYAMNLPASVVITGCDSVPILQQALEAARTFYPMTEAQRAALLTKTAPLASEGRYETLQNQPHLRWYMAESAVAWLEKLTACLSTPRRLRPQIAANDQPIRTRTGSLAGRDGGDQDLTPQSL